MDEVIIENNDNNIIEEEKYIEIYPEQHIKSKEFATKLVKILDSKKAGNIKVIEISKQTIIADFFVIATGTSSTHIRSLADELDFRLKEEDTEPSRISTSADWVAIDYDSVIVHIFNSEARDYYKLEKLWGDGENIDVVKLLEMEGSENK
jgi:ribosome-associated protein